jgi:hypothetical protein
VNLFLNFTEMDWTPEDSLGVPQGAEDGLRCERRDGQLNASAVWRTIVWAVFRSRTAQAGLHLGDRILLSIDSTHGGR